MGLNAGRVKAMILKLYLLLLSLVLGIARIGQGIVE